MKETTPAAMPPCFDRWCQRFDDIFGHLAQKREFRNYLGGLLGESERKNLSQIIDDSGHRKSGNFTEGVGRQYIGEIGKTDNGVVAVTSHLYDGKKNLPLDIELSQKAESLPLGKADPEFKKKPEIALELIERSLDSFL